MVGVGQDALGGGVANLENHHETRRFIRGWGGVNEWIHQGTKRNFCGGV